MSIELEYYCSVFAGVSGFFVTGEVAKLWRRREAEPREKEARAGIGRIIITYKNAHPWP